MIDIRTKAAFESLIRQISQMAQTIAALNGEIAVLKAVAEKKPDEPAS